MKISVIMPVYNSAKYLESAIASVLSQDVDLEIIAVDDCSSDSSRDILLDLSLKDSRIKAVFNEENIGVAAVRNKALSLATGEYLAFCDSDDIVPEGAYRALLSDADCDIVVGAHRDMYDSGKLAPICSVNKNERSSLFHSLFSVSCLWTKLIKHSFVIEGSLKFDTDMTIGEDVVFLAEAVKRSPSFKVTDALVYYHCLHDSSVSRSLTHIYTFDAFKKHIECRKKVLEILNDIDGVRDFMYVNASRFIIDFILKMNDTEELDEAFDMFKEYMLEYKGFSNDHALFQALLGVPYDDFVGMGPAQYIEHVRAIPSCERVLAEYQAGLIGFSWIKRYIKAWMRFKLCGRKDKK